MQPPLDSFAALSIPLRWPQSGSNPAYPRKKTQRVDAPRDWLQAQRPSAPTHFRLALAAFAGRCVAVGIGEPSRAFFVCWGSVVFGATAPLGV